MADTSTTGGIRPDQTTTAAWFELDEIAGRLALLIEDAEAGNHRFAGETLVALKVIYAEQCALTRRLQAADEDSTPRDELLESHQDMLAIADAFTRIVRPEEDSEDDDGHYVAARIVRRGAWETIDRLKERIDTFLPAPSVGAAS